MLVHAYTGMLMHASIKIEPANGCRAPICENWTWSTNISCYTNDKKITSAQTLSSVLLMFPTASQSMGLRGRAREDSDDKLCFSVTSISPSSMLFCRSAMLSLDL